MTNYMEYHIMGSVPQVQLKPGCFPSKFDCQPDRRKRSCSTSERSSDILKKQRMMIIRDCLNESVESNSGCTSSTSSVPEDTSVTTAVLPKSGEGSAAFRTPDKSVHESITDKYRRNKDIQANIKLVDQTSSLIKSSHKSVSTSPFKMEYYSMKAMPLHSSISKISKKILMEEQHLDGNISLYTPPVTSTEYSPSTNRKYRKRRLVSQIKLTGKGNVEKKMNTHILTSNMLDYITSTFDKGIDKLTEHNKQDNSVDLVPSTKIVEDLEEIEKCVKNIEKKVHEYSLEVSVRSSVLDQKCLNSQENEHQRLTIEVAGLRRELANLDHCSMNPIPKSMASLDRRENSLHADNSTTM